MRDWATQYKGLEVRVQAALDEYNQKMAVRAASQAAMDTQAALCRDLQDKVGMCMHV